MNFKTPFKVLTTAALIGTLSLSAVAPGAASAAEKTAKTVQTKAELAASHVVLEDAKGNLITLDYNTYLEAKSVGIDLGAEPISIKVGDKFYNLNDFLEAKSVSNNNLEEAVKLLDKNDLSQDINPAEGTIEDGKLVVAPVEEDFTVTEIAAINATTVEVKFNKAVSDADATGISGGTGASNLSKYSVGAAQPTEVTLSKDGKTATLKFAASVEGENAAVVVNPIVLAADDNKKTERYAKTLTYKDDVKPEVTAIKATTGTDKVTSATIEFSEPISAVEAIKVDGKALVSTTNYTLTPGATKLDLTGLDLDATKEHTVEIVNLKDTAKTNSGAANVTSYITKTFTATVDKTAPTVASVEPQNDNKLVVTFSKPVNLDTTAAANTIINLVDADLVDQTTTNKTLLPATAKFTAVGTDKTKYVVTLNASPFATNATTAKYTVKFLANALTDLQGNKLAAVTKDVTFAKDVVAPKLTNSAYRLDADGKVKELSFTFDEDVDFAAAASVAAPATPLTDLLADTSVNIENGVASDLKAAFGTAAIPVGTFTVDKNVIKFTLATPVAVEGKFDFNVAAGKLKDTSLSATTNINKKSAFTLDFGTADAETTFKAVSANGTGGTTIPATGDNTITVNYGIKVKGGAVAGSATDASAYKIGGKALPAGTTITLNSAQDTATIVIPAGSIATTDTNAVLTVEGVKSLDGSKTLVPYTKTINVIDNVAPTLTSATLTSDNKLIVGFSEALNTTPGAIDLEVYINGHKVTTTPTPAAGSGSDAGKYIINLGSLLTYGSNTVLGIDTTNDITVATGSDVTNTYSLLSSSLINSVKVKVSNSTTLTDTATNGLTKGTEITVK